MTPSDTPPVGGDWVLVPREPTEEMVDAYNGALRAWVESLTPEQRGRLKRRATATGARQFKISPRQKLIARWSAVLSAAPPPPVGDRGAVARFGIGEPVCVSPSYRYSGDWLGIDLWVCGISVRPATGHVEYAVSEHWPPRTLGDITDEFREEHLTPRSSPSLSPGELEGTGSSCAESGGSRPAAVKSDSAEGH